MEALNFKGTGNGFKEDYKDISQQNNTKELRRQLVKALNQRDTKAWMVIMVDHNGKCHFRTPNEDHYELCLAFTGMLISQMMGDEEEYE